MRDVSKKLSIGEEIDLLNAVSVLNRISKSCKQTLKECLDVMFGSVLMDFKEIEVSSCGGVPLEKVCLFVLNRALRINSHL